MTQNKRVIGITGGSGCGKSYISSLLREKGFLVIDADVTAHKVMEQDLDCVSELSDFFGADIYESGKLNRQRLAAVVFADRKKLESLNKISHKYIIRSINSMVETAESEFVFVDGATLIESGMKLDMMIGVLADYETRKKRIILRDSLSEDRAEARLKAQPKDKFYLDRCDFVVYNNGGGVDVEEILNKVKGNCI